MMMYQHHIVVNVWLLEHANLELVDFQLEMCLKMSTHLSHTCRTPGQSKYLVLPSTCVYSKYLVMYMSSTYANHMYRTCT